MNSQANLSLLRQVLTFLGALLAGRGIVSANQASTLVNDITVAIPALISIGSIAWSVYAHWKQVKVPEQTVVQTPTAGRTTAAVAVKEGVLSAVAILAVLALTMPAFAATPTPTPRPKLTTAQAQANPLAVLDQFAINDLEAALADAQAAGDKVSAPCWQALLTAAQSRQGATVGLPSGVFSGIQKARDLKMAAANLLSQSGPLASINVACAPLILDVNNTLLMLGVGTGLVVGSGGLALPALPGILPMLLSLPK